MNILRLGFFAALLGFPAFAHAQGFSSSALGPPMKDQRHKGSDYVPGDSRPSRLTVLELPLHGHGDEDYKKLQGPFQYVKGESLLWNYSFAYWGTSNAGRVTLQAGQALTFLGVAGRNLQFAAPGVGAFVVVPPPNIGLTQILNFAVVPLSACNKAMVLNRLGQPTSQASDATTGETKFVYSSGKLHRAWTTQDQVTTSYGGDYVPGVGYGPVQHVTTSIPRHESEDYIAYSFEIVFDANDRVSGVNDLVR